MSDRHILEEFFGRELDQMEHVLQRGRASKYRDDDFTVHGADHHFGKADSHMCRMGAYYDGMDGETGVPHGVLTVIRLLMVLRCAQDEGAEVPS